MNNLNTIEATPLPSRRTILLFYLSRKIIPFAIIYVICAFTLCTIPVQSLQSVLEIFYKIDKSN